MSPRLPLSLVLKLRLVVSKLFLISDMAHNDPFELLLRVNIFVKKLLLLASQSTELSRIPVLRIVF
jgi:hypothetical protein